MTDILSSTSRPGLSAMPVAPPASATVTARNTLLVALAIQLALLIPSLIAATLDDRLLIGVSVWSKPIKFELSLITLNATLVWLLPAIAEPYRSGRTTVWAAITVGLMSTLEISYLVLQAARGRPSHFNDSTPPEAALYSAMGIGAVLIVGGCFVLGLTMLRHGDPRLPRGLRLGGAWGLMLGAVLTVVTAGVMGSGQLSANSHWVGGIRSDAGGLFLLGWSRSGGDLRVPHFFATHLMHALPVLGLLLDRTAPRRVTIGLWIGGLAGTLAVAATFVQAVMGRPFL